MSRVTGLVLLTLALPCLALDNGLGLRPQMGWNSWNFFGCNISSTLIRRTADLLVSSGLAEAGYTFLNLDDCWAKGRDKDGNIYPDPEAFPEGMKTLGDYIHSKGLKYGVYSDAGFETCAKRPGSLHYEENDANSYASWGVDYLKYDNCNTDNTTARSRYPVMRDALNKTGRPIFFSMCEWGLEDPWTWAGAVGNSWRTTGDIDKTWNRTMWILDRNEPLYKYAGPGAWNDPDMLEVGNGMSDVEGEAHFSLWALMKAPLLIGCDITTMTAATKTILMNKEVIAVNQDPLGVQGRLVYPSGPNPHGGEVWYVPLTSNTGAAIVFNRGEMTIDFKFKLSNNETMFHVRDLWLHKDLGITDAVQGSVPPHGVMMLKLRPAGGDDIPMTVEGFANSVTLQSNFVSVVNSFLSSETT